MASVEIAPPGFLNLRLDPGWLVQSLRGVVEAGSEWGRSDVGAGERVQVEFVSANPTGPLLVSAGRGAVVGDTIARLLAAVGHEVQREFYVNDTGRQTELFGQSILARRGGDPPPEGGYQGEYVADLAAEAPDSLFAGEPEGLVAAVTEWAMARVLGEIREDLAAIGIGFDRWFSERELDAAAEREMVEELEKAGHVARHDGAVWIRFPDGKEDVLYKSGGEATYFCHDLLYHRGKLVVRGFDRVVDVWGADHQNQVRRMMQAMELIGVDPKRLTIVVHQMVHLRGDSGLIKVSKRRGNLVLLRDLVEELGSDAVRYHYLLRGADAAMDFDIDVARRQSNENPVFYAQYAHARLCSVRAVARETGVAADPAGLARLIAPGELDLTKELLELPDVVEAAARALEPHHLPHYAQRLAEKVHAFYHAGNRDGSLRVLVDDHELASARLFLCEAARVTMANLLDLMGVSAPERM